MSQQPLITHQGNVLVFNGEIFDGIQVAPETSDSEALAQALSECETVDKVLNVFAVLEGAWAICYYHSPSSRVFFSRDYFGRRSLLCRLKEMANFELASVAQSNTDENQGWSEVACDGVYMLDLTDFTFTCAPWMSFIRKHTKRDEEFRKKLSCINEENILLTPMQSRYSLDIPDCLESDINFDEHKDPLKAVQSYLQAEGREELCKEFIQKLRVSVRKRLTHCKRGEGSSSVALLFSGGIDCTVIALLAHEFVSRDESIDLLNVAFERRGYQKDDIGRFAVPDRITGRSSLQELKKLCPEREWRFVEIDIEVSDLRKLRQERILHLTYPKQTVLDDSIACALWFAARGLGTVTSDDGHVTLVESHARLVLCGMGADEQLGGYSRHRGVYENSGKDLSRVGEEIEMEVERIYSRNLGRDDRVISDHNKEARFPYLDEEVVSFLHHVPLHAKVDFSLPRGVGEKLLLRASAYLLGLRDAAVLPKRAIQFGSRVAKAENSKEKGNHKCLRLQISGEST